MEKEPKPEEISEESYRIFRDGFYVSSGSTNAHAMYIYFMAWKRRTTPHQALSYYNGLYVKLSKTSFFKERIAKDIESKHRKQVLENLNISLAINLSSVGRVELSSGQIAMADIYMNELPAQLPSPTSLDLFESELKSSNIRTVGRFFKVLEYIDWKYKDRQVLTALKNVASVIGLFDIKTWFIQLSDRQRLAYRNRGERICKEALGKTD